jgi:hypothetical protein
VLSDKCIESYEVLRLMGRPVTQIGILMTHVEKYKVQMQIILPIEGRAYKGET